MFFVLKGLRSHLLSAVMYEDHQCLDYSGIMQTIPQCVLCLCSYLSTCQRKNRFSLSGEEGGCGKKRLFLCFFLIEGAQGHCSGALAVPCMKAPAGGPLGAGMQPVLHSQAMHPPRDTFSSWRQPTLHSSSHCLLPQHPV